MRDRMAVILVFGILGTIFFLVIAIKTNINQAIELPRRADNYGSNPQFVLLAFDGSASIPMWQETINFANELASQGKPAYFTYFVSGVYFLTEKNKNDYQPPSAPRGTSLIGFASSVKDISERVGEMKTSIAEGHEIASHAVGHFNGAKWSLSQWEQELDSFQKILASVAPKIDVVGFRAPDLGVNDNLEQALAKRNYRYDASRVSSNSDWPTKNKFGLWEFPLAIIKLPPDNFTTISMDYNIFVIQTKAKNILEKNSLTWQANRDYLLQAYRDYFYQHYRRNRAPIFIGHHFSKWNDGVYWEALKDFAREVCGLPKVHCITHRALADYLDQKK